jgi:hypothetical protein
MSTAGESSNGAKKSGTPKTRSPNYPALDLKTAIDKARIVYRRMGKHPTGADVVASLWSSSPKSSSFKLALAAVRAYWLFEDHADEGDRLIKVSSLALDILEFYGEGSPEWVKAVQSAALSPKIHAALWEKYGGELPADEEIRRHLLKDRGFNHKTVDEFIDEFRATLSFAGLIGGDKIRGVDPQPDPGDSRPPKPIKQGEFVQWTSQGVDQFDLPRRVVGASEDGRFVFVEGTRTGIPANQVAVVDPPTVDRAPSRRPISQPGMREDTFTLDEGQVVIQLPDRLSASSFEDLKDWLDLVVRKAKRTVREPADEPGKAG